MNSAKRLLNLTEVRASSVLAEDQTTVRIPKEMHEKLRVLAAIEGASLAAMMQTVIGDYIRTYQSVTGQSLSPRKLLKKTKI